jgi:hypothetical protein
MSDIAYAVRRIQALLEHADNGDAADDEVVRDALIVAARDEVARLHKLTEEVYA